MNHFELFGLSPSVDVDMTALAQKRRTIALSVHPDRLTGADPATRRKAAETTAALNEAFKTLSDPVRRVAYVLKLSGVDIEGDDAGRRLELPPEFLEGILARRERLEDLRAQRALGSLTEFGRELQGEIDRSLASAQDALRKDELARAARTLGELRYYARLLAEVDSLEEELAS
jgi:molecular chaperone HscB